MFFWFRSLKRDSKLSVVMFCLHVPPWVKQSSHPKKLCRRCKDMICIILHNFLFYKWDCTESEIWYFLQMLRIGPLNLKGKQCARGRVLASSTNQITITKWQSYSHATMHTIIVLQLTEYDVAPILERHIWSKHIQTLMQVCCRTNLVEHMPCARSLPSVLRPLLHKKTTQKRFGSRGSVTLPFHSRAAPQRSSSLVTGTWQHLAVVITGHMGPVSTSEWLDKEHIYMQNRIYVYTCIYVYTRVYVHVCIAYIYMYIIYIVNILIMKSIRGRFSLKPKPRITNCLSLTQFGADTTKIWCCHIGLTHTLRCSCQDLAP